ncbi:hypothetical protein [Duganella sp. Dugasp56]|uniref:hypothetical protein n=1 Tax=Duganella sp. Dugasp56 TaxID=3243046 RepID=UPI0039B09964
MVAPPAATLQGGAILTAIEPPLLDDSALADYAVVHAVPTLGGEHDARWKGLLLAL